MPPTTLTNTFIAVYGQLESSTNNVTNIVTTVGDAQRRSWE